MRRITARGFIASSVILLVLGAAAGESALGIAFLVVGLATIGLVLRGPRVFASSDPVPWNLMAAGIGLFMIGEFAGALRQGPSYPGIREPFDLAGYVVLTLAALRFGRARRVSRDRTNILDSLILGLGVGSIAWFYIVSEFRSSATLSTLGAYTGMAFSGAAMLLLLSVIRLALGPGARPRSYYYLAVAAFGGLLAEVLLELELIGRTPFEGTETLSLTAGAAAIVMAGAAAAHPSMTALTDAPSTVTPTTTAGRFLAMTLSTLIPPALIVLDAPGASREQVGVLVGLWALLSVIVMARVFALTRVATRVAEMDRTLAQADAALATASDDAAMATATLACADELLGGDRSLALFRRLGDGWTLVGTSGSILPHAPRGEVPREGFADEDDGPRGYRSTLRLTGSLDPWVAVIEAPHRPAEEELQRVRVLFHHFAQAVESASLRDEVTREQFERRFRALIDRSSDIIIVLDHDDRISYASPAMNRWLGYSDDEVIGSGIGVLATPEHRSLLEAAARGDRLGPAEVELLAADGTVRWFSVDCSDQRAANEIRGIVVTAREISSRKQAELDLRRNEARFRSLVQHSTDLVAVVDDDGIITWISPSIGRILCRSAATLRDSELSAIVHPGDRDALASRLRSLARNPDSVERAEIRFRHLDGSWRTLELSVTDLRGEPSVAGYVVNAHDVTDRLELEEDLRHQVLHDNLTGIANRVLFRDRVALGLAEREDDLAVAMIDLDDFKTINDSLGHSAGDHVLEVVAFRLSQHVREGDTTARLGGDEFALVMPAPGKRSDVLAVCHRILAAIAEPIDLDGREFSLRASMGVVFPSDLTDPTPETVIRSADLAMYGAKSRGKGRVSIFDDSMHAGAFERLELKADLGEALERGELDLHYQPIVALETGRVVGFEALARWNHGNRGAVSPATFIPLAEETGLIIPIGAWVARTALRQLKAWQQVDPDLTMSVNVSGRQLEDPDVIEMILDAVASADVDPETVVLELTETIVVQDSPELVARVHALRALGVSVLADDFGSGFASYAALQSLPFTGVKLDRTLVAGLVGEAPARAEAQIRSLIEMAAATGMSVVAEGIESSVEADALRSLNCQRAQGFFYARPAVAESAFAHYCERAGVAPPPLAVSKPA